MEKDKVEAYKRKSAYVRLKGYCIFSMKDEGHFIEATQWYNSEGFDVTIEGKGSENFSITYGQFDALKKLIKELDK